MLRPELQALLFTSSLATSFLSAPPNQNGTSEQAVNAAQAEVPQVSVPNTTNIEVKPQKGVIATTIVPKLANPLIPKAETLIENEDGAKNDSLAMISDSLVKAGDKARLWLNQNNQMVCIIALVVSQVHSCPGHLLPF